MSLDYKKKFYVTTPIYYCNSKPHLGTLYSTLLADVSNRLFKLMGAETFFLTGTDEHGQKIAQAAQSAGLDPKKFVDGMVEDYKDLWSLYNIDYNRFIRTTDEYHVRGVKNWIEKLISQGDIYKGVYSGWYCTPCESFVTEKAQEVEGGEVFCSECKRPTKEISEECYFFKLSVYRDRLLDFYEKNPGFVTPSERLNEVISFVKTGLKDLCISRKTIDWGIPFPGDESQAVYVWADALNNYLTAIGFGDEKKGDVLKKWWPADLQIVGKDIFRFHAVYWPAFLMAAGFGLPGTLLVHGLIQVDGEKMSKSRGNVVDPRDIADKYGVDEVRYFLVRLGAITQDFSFSEVDLRRRINSDLANDLGNLLNRVLTLAKQNNMSNVEAPKQLGSPELELRDKLWSMINKFYIELESFYFHRAYAHLWKFINQVNSYFHSQEPWKLAKKDPERFGVIISGVCNSLYAVAVLAWPVMPAKMERIIDCLGKKLDLGQNFFEKLSVSSWLESFDLKVCEPIFKKFSEKKEDAASKKLGVESQVSAASGASDEKHIDFSVFKSVQIVIGTILSCGNIPGSDKLYKLDVDFGGLGKRQILSGIKKFLKPEELIGKQGIFVLNLKPRSIMGLESQGMMLFATNKDGSPVMVGPLEKVENGLQLS